MSGIVWRGDWQCGNGEPLLGSKAHDSLTGVIADHQIQRLQYWQHARVAGNKLPRSLRRTRGCTKQGLTSHFCQVFHIHWWGTCHDREVEVLPPRTHCVSKSGHDANVAQGSARLHNIPFHKVLATRTSCASTFTVFLSCGTWHYAFPSFHRAVTQHVHNWSVHQP